MKKIIMLVSALAILIVAMSGCVDDNENPESVEMSAGNLVMLKEVSEGFEYLGSPSFTTDDVKEDYVDVEGIVDSAEGIYQNPDLVEVHIMVIEMESTDSAQELISEYKSSFKPLASGNRFTDESFNGHVATRIKDYVNTNGGQVERYEYIWNNENFVFIVDGNPDDYIVLRTFAEATEY